LSVDAVQVTGCKIRLRSDL